MTKANTLLHAGKQLVAIAAGRAFRGEPLKTRAQDLVGDPASDRQGVKKPGEKGAEADVASEKEGAQDPGNPNAVDRDDQDPGQEKG